jgi:hypothetical protein
MSSEAATHDEAPSPSQQAGRAPQDAPPLPEDLGHRQPRAYPLDALLLAAACGLIYALFGQDVFYKADGQQLLHLYRGGYLSWPYHPLYLPLMTPFVQAAEALGATPYHGAVLFSAFCTAVGVFFGKLAFSGFGLSRAQSLAAASLAGMTRPVLFFATVIELPAALFGAAGLAFWISSWLYPRPGIVGALLLGLATSFAAGVHNSGHLLTGILILHWLARDAQRRESILPAPKSMLFAGIALALHVGLLFALPYVYTHYGFDASPGRSLAFLRDGFGGSQSPTLLPGLIWREWLSPFMPLSLLMLLAFTRARLRGTTAALLLGLAPYALLTLLLLGGEPEYGAYFVPCALPVAGLVVQLFPPRAAILWIVLSAGLGILAVRDHEKVQDQSSFAESVEVVLGDREGVIFVADGSEWSSMLIHAWDRKFLMLIKELEGFPQELPADPAIRVAAEQQMEQLAQGLARDLVQDHKAGRVVLFSPGARAFLERRAVIGPILTKQLDAHFEWKRIERGRKPLWQLIPRS